MRACPRLFPHPLHGPCSYCTKGLDLKEKTARLLESVARLLWMLARDLRG